MSQETVSLVYNNPSHLTQRSVGYFMLTAQSSMEKRNATKGRPNRTFELDGGSLPSVGFNYANSLSCPKVPGRYGFQMASRYLLLTFYWSSATKVYEESRGKAAVRIHG